MPNYKVVNADQLDADLEAVAQAIRTKGGTSASLAFPSGFVSAVEGIQSGGGVGNSDAIIMRTATEITSNATEIGNYAFYTYTTLTSAIFPMATKIGASAFYGCSSLDTVSFPYVTSAGPSAFRGCSKLNRISLNIPIVSSQIFYGCAVLEVADMGQAKSIALQAFSNCYCLKALVLRSNSVATLASSNALANCHWLKGTTNETHNPTGGVGYVYVPRALTSRDLILGEYEINTNWKKAGVRFRALEDYTLDGTIDGELDIEKMLADLEGSGGGSIGGGDQEIM